MLVTSSGHVMSTMLHKILYLSKPEQLASGSRCVSLQYVALAEESHATLGLMKLACLLSLCLEAVIESQAGLNPPCTPTHDTDLEHTWQMCNVTAEAHPAQKQCTDR